MSDSRMLMLRNVWCMHLGRDPKLKQSEHQKSEQFLYTSACSSRPRLFQANRDDLAAMNHQYMEEAPELESLKLEPVTLRHNP